MMIDMSIINQDIELFETNFSNINFHWDSVKWIYAEDCLKDWLKKIKAHKLKNTNFYYPKESTIVYDKIGINYDFIRFHEMGHLIHHQLLKYKRFRFSKKYRVTIPLYWHMHNSDEYYDRNMDGIEIFADIFSDTMMRYKNPNCIMFDYNERMIKILREIG